MSTTLGISFSAQQCHAVMLMQNKVSFTYQNARSIQHVFEDFSVLPALLTTFKSTCSKNTRVVVGIPSQHIMTRDFTLDAHLSDAHILQFLKSRALQLFGHDSDRLCLDYETQPTDEKDKQTINVVAAHQSMICQIQAAFAAAKIHLHAIDVDVFAIARANEHWLSKTFLALPETNTYAAAAGLCLWRKA